MAKEKTSTKNKKQGSDKKIKSSMAKSTGSEKNFEVKARLGYLRMSPKKVRLVVNAIRSMSVEEALSQLHFINKAATHPLIKLINSAVANAENNFGLEKKNLIIKKLTVNEGPTLRRWKPRAHGRATPIRKRSSHIDLLLEDISGQQPKEKAVSKKEEAKIVTPDEAKQLSKSEDKEPKAGQEKDRGPKKGFAKKLFSRKTGTN